MAVIVGDLTPLGPGGKVGAVPLMGVPEFNLIMNRDVFWMLCVCGAVCGGAACVWYWSGRSGESVPERGSVAGGGGGGEAESGGNNQPTKQMNESDGEFRKGRDVMARIIEIAHRIRGRLDEDPGVEGVAARRYDDTELANVLPLISREEWVFVCILDVIRVVRNDGSCGYNGLQGYSVRNYLREVGIEKMAELFERLYPFARRVDDIEGDRQDEKITDDEYDVLVDPINLQMDEMEAASGVESFDEMYSLLLTYAVKHGFAEVGGTGGAGEGDGRRECGVVCGVPTGRGIFGWG